MIIWESCIKKEEKITIIFSIICPKMNLSASFWYQMRQKKLLCHKFHGTYFPPSCSSHLRLSYHPMSDDLCHLPMSHVHHYTLLCKTSDITDSHTRLIRHLFTCHIFLYPSSSKVFRHLLDNLIGIVMEIVILYC